MTAPTNTFTSASAIGNREDLADFISRITPTQTPFFSMIGSTKASATLHEWQTQALNAPQANAAAEGDDATNIAIVPTVRLGNRTQILTKTVQIAGTQEAVNKAGRKSEMAYQIALRGLELRTDVEYAFTNNNVAASGTTRQARGLVGWAGDNVNAGAGYVAPNYITNVAQTDGTTRAFSESQLKDVLQKCYTAGGEPNVIMMSAVMKQNFSTFTGNSTRFKKAEDEQLNASIDVYVSDFGTLKAVPNRIQRGRDVWVLQSDKWRTAMLRPFFAKELAINGDSERKQLIVETTLEAVNPKANGLIADVA